jgi:hypothetical protein
MWQDGRRVMLGESGSVKEEEIADASGVGNGCITSLGGERVGFWSPWSASQWIR